jgi:hypothetical protein
VLTANHVFSHLLWWLSHELLVQRFGYRRAITNAMVASPIPDFEDGSLQLWLQAG